MWSLLRKKINKTIIYCFIVSILLLLFTSKCSFMYPFNDWVDANAFFTVGKAMANKVIPYKDIFEQKGIFLYFIYMIGYLLSNTTFKGIFILEIISWTITLYNGYKICMFFLSKKSSLILLPTFMCLACISKSFVHGGSAEEFCLPLFMITLYYLIKNYKKEELNYKELFISGITSGLVFLIKYTMLGFWFGFMASIFFDLVFNKKYKKAFLSCLVFLLGMFTPFIISLIYFGLNKGIMAFIKVYFFTNINSYSMEATVLTRLSMLIKNYVATVSFNGFFLSFLILLFPVNILLLNIKKRGKISLIFVYFLTILGIYFGLRFYIYYLFPIVVFMFLSLISLFNIVDKYISKIKIKKYYVGLIFLIIFLFGCSYNFANYKEMIGVKKENLFQYKFASIILKEKNPTLLNYGFLDCGLYTTTGIIPTTYYFEKQNFSYKRYPENMDMMKKYIKNKETMFVIYYSDKKISNEDIKLFSNYKIVASAKQKFEKIDKYAYLFKSI